MAEAVKVAVRVRPFNGREKDRGAKLIIAMNGKFIFKFTFFVPLLVEIRACCPALACALLPTCLLKQ